MIKKDMYSKNTTQNVFRKTSKNHKKNKVEKYIFTKTSFN